MVFSVDRELILDIHELNGIDRLTAFAGPARSRASSASSPALAFESSVGCLLVIIVQGR